MSKNLLGMGLSFAGLVGVGLLAMGCGADVGAAQEESVGTEESALSEGSPLANPCTGAPACSGVSVVNMDSPPWSGSKTVTIGTTSGKCFYTTHSLDDGRCDAFGTRTLKLNGTLESCNGANWPSPLPAKRYGGYCIAVSSGPYTYSSVTVWP
jgi:hypothetical protein